MNTPDKMICENCLKEFQPKHKKKGQRFCSVKCKTEAYWKKHKIIEI